MIVEVGNIKCRVAAATPEEHSWIRGYLDDIKVDRRGGRNIVLFNPILSTFPGGLMGLVRKAARRDNVRVEELDRRSSSLSVDATADLSWLRDYQIEAVEACVRERRGIVRAPTGSGKGDMIAGIVKKLPGRWLFVVHREFLVSQQGERFTKYTGLEPNDLSRRPVEAWRIEVGFNTITFQSLAAALRKDRAGTIAKLGEVEGLIVDECHVAPADVYFAAVMDCPAEYRLGFSGTPLDRTDNRSLMAVAAFGTIIYTAKADELIERGFLARPKITMATVKHPRLKLPPSAAKAFQVAYDTLVVGSEDRNAKIVKLAQDAPKPCMVFVKNIVHGKALSRALNAEGVLTEFVWGEKKPEVRRAAVKRLIYGDSEAIVASVVFQEGVDIPNLASVIIASGGKSVIAALQRVGRGMRTDGGAKLEFEVFDILDKGSRMLERHSSRRMNTYVREGYQTIIVGDDGLASAYKPRLRTRRERREEEGR